MLFIFHRPVLACARLFASTDFSCRMFRTTKKNMRAEIQPAESKKNSKLLKLSVKPPMTERSD